MKNTLETTFRLHLTTFLMAISLSLISEAQAQVDTKLTASDGAAFDNFGRALSLSGENAMIGAYLDDDKGSNSGSVYFFKLANGVWTESAKLTASDGEASNVFGSSVDIAGDRAVIGARNDNDNGISSGSAYVFELIHGVWTEASKLIASDGGPIEEFGSSVSISGDYAIVGAHQHDAFYTNSGAAYVFERLNGAWNEVAKLTPNDAPAGGGAFFGISVSLSENLALVGAHLDNEKGANAGAAYVFERQNGFWVEAAKLTASDGESEDRFGFQLSLQGDRALIGSYHDDDNGTDAGAAYIFELQNGVWIEVAKLTASDGSAADEFGGSVSLSNGRALVGAYLDDDNGTDSGSAYVFELQNGNWTEITKLSAGDGDAGDAYGWLFSVSLSGDHALVGAYLDDDKGTDSGSAYVYNLNDTVAVTDLINAFSTQVDAFFTAGLIEPRQHSMLSNRLKQALSATEREAFHRALDSMEAFLGLVNRLISSRQLTQEEAQPLLDAANEIIALLETETPAAVAGLIPRNSLDVVVQNLPESFALHQNHPNPFNPSTIIRFALPEQAKVSLTIYDMLGREVQRLVDGVREAGNHEITFEASGLPSGTYLYQLETPVRRFTRRMILTK